jgi:hypothetical protein
MDRGASSTSSPRSPAGGVHLGVGRCDVLATPRAVGLLLDAAGALGIDAPEASNGLLPGLLDDFRAAPRTRIVIEDALG